MVEYADVDQCQGVDQTLGNAAVGGAGLGYAGRVIMREYQRGGVVVQCGLDHFPGINAGAVDGAAKHFLVTDDTMPIVQKHAGEDFMWTARQF